jgi:hypothetical protein
LSGNKQGGDVYMKSYFVSYFYWKETQQGVACCQLGIKDPVSGWDDILMMISELKRLNPEFTEVAILNWRRFEDSE